MRGTIKSVTLDKGYGFIRGDGGIEYFFHKTALVGVDMTELRKGDAVTFEVEQTGKGPRAEDVELDTK